MSAKTTGPSDDLCDGYHSRNIRAKWCIEREARGCCHHVCERHVNAFMYGLCRKRTLAACGKAGEKRR